MTSSLLGGPGDLFERGLVPLVLAAERRGLWRALTPAPQSAEALATRCGASPRAAALVLDALAAAGACTRTPEGYARDEGMPGGWPWSELDGFLANGTPVVPIDAPARRGELYRSAVGYLGARFRRPAEALAEVLPARGRVLDVGCGSAVWSRAMLARSPEASLVGLDLPEVVAELTPRLRAEEPALAERVTLVAGDYFQAVPEGLFDRVVMANIVHLETPEAAARLVARFAERLAPGGELVIIDAFADETFDDRLGRAFYAVHLGLRTALGGVYGLADAARWCEAAGLGGARLVRCPGYSVMGAVVATRA